MKRLSVILTSLLFLSSLTSCHKDTCTENPFFEEWTAQYGFPPFDRIRTVHYVPAFERAVSVHNAEIAAITENKETPSFKNTIEALDLSGQMLDMVSDVFAMQSGVDSDEEMQAVVEQVRPLLAAHEDDMIMNRVLFNRIHEVYERRYSLDLKPDQIRLTEKTHDAFVRSGALLDGKEGQRLKEINQELVSLSIIFGSNVLAETSGYTLEVPSSQANDILGQPKEAARALATREGLTDMYVFTLSGSSMIPFLSSCSYRTLREQIYTAYLECCAHGDEYDNARVINDILRLRNEKAHILGFGSFAEYAISGQTAGAPEAVYSLLEELFPKAVDKAREELDLMDDLLGDDIREATFESWDWWYYAEKIRKKNYALNDEMLKPYFSLDNVRQGAFNLANRLYGITFRPVAVPVYNEDVTVFEVLDKDLSHLGLLSFDFFSREGKRQGSWCGYYRRQRYSEDGLERTSPIVGIVCNFQKPAQASAQALLSLDETSSVFHEFGHALHSLFTNVRYNGLLAAEKDFMEFPALIMENWAFDPDILRSYASNSRSNELISDSMIEKINRSRKFNQGFRLTRLLAAALLDLDVHSARTFDNIDPKEFTKKMLNEKRGLIPQIEPMFRLPYFSHIFDGGYESAYYSYIWAEVLDKDAFAAFCEGSDHTDRRTAEAFRHRILERGGSEDGMALYRAFRGCDPDRTHMLRARGLWTDPELNEERQDIEYVEEDEKQNTL